MKKILVTLLAILLLTVLAACGDPEPTATPGGATAAPTQSPPTAPEPTDPSHEHSYTEAVTAPTCTEKGYTTYTCTCGDSYTDNEVPYAHSYDENGQCANCSRKVSVGLKYTKETDWQGTEYYVISGIGSCEDTAIVIPEVYEGLPVAGIAKEAFKNRYKITSVDIPNSITSIGIYAFDGCRGLTNITIPDSVTVISWGTFSGCTGLISITIPDSVTRIDYSAFSGCTGLTSITIPDSVTWILIGTFSGCTGLISITIPDSVTEIGNHAFRRCTGLTEIHFDGTMEQWNAITKDGWWDTDTGNYTIYCTDGEIPKS